MGKLQKVVIYSDGSCLGNPGPGGYGTILHYTDSQGNLHERKYSSGYRKTTNNRMEIMGVTAGFLALKRPCLVEVYTDSQYVVNAFEKGWIRSWKKKGWKNLSGPVKNVDLWKKLLKAMNGHQVTFHWVKGHAGNTYNEKCDKMARQAAAGENLIRDAGADFHR